MQVSSQPASYVGSSALLLPWHFPSDQAHFLPRKTGKIGELMLMRSSLTGESKGSWMNAFSFIHWVDRTSHIIHVRKLYDILHVTHCIVLFLLFYLDVFVPKQTTWKSVIVSSSCLEDPKLKAALKMKQELLKGQEAKSSQRWMWLSSINERKFKFNTYLL